MITRSAHPILYGTLIVGTLDALDAIIFFGLRSGATPGRIFKSIAAGVYGRKAYQMGIHSIGLGVMLHYFIAFLIVSTFYIVSRGVRPLRRHSLIAGVLYGVGVYFVMNYAVIPMSATARGAFMLPVFVNGILIHAFGVGLPSAWFSRD
jgi:hypothetical protein